MAKKKGNGEGSITRHKSGLYMARYTVQTPAGPKRKTIYGKTRREADEKLTAAKSDRDKGLMFDAENQTLGEYLDSWLKGSVRGYVRQSTFDSYEIAVRVHISQLSVCGLDARWCTTGVKETGRDLGSFLRPEFYLQKRRF